MPAMELHVVAGVPSPTAQRRAVEWLRGLRLLLLLYLLVEHLADLLFEAQSVRHLSAIQLFSTALYSPPTQSANSSWHYSLWGFCTSLCLGERLQSLW